MEELDYYKNLSIEDIDGEIWKEIQGFEGMYEISNLGRLKSKSRVIRDNRYGKISSKDKILKQRKDKNGYLVLALNKDNKTYDIKMHRVIAKTFIPNPENKPQVNHKKGIKTDNRVSELEWSTTHENQTHRYAVLKRNGVNLGRFGSRNKLSKKVIQYSLDLKYIKTWQCINDIQRSLGFLASGIVSCCKKIQKSSKGFVWRYASNKKNKIKIKPKKIKSSVIKDLKGEIWIDVLGYEGLYSVSNLGRVKSLSRQIRNHKKVGIQISEEKVFKINTNSKKYSSITLVKNKKTNTHKIHRLVAIAFIPNPENKSQVNHIDGNKSNNHVNNLEWHTPSENQFHNFRVLGYKGANLGRKGSENKNSKKTYQYDIDKNLIKEWDSLSEIQNKLGFHARRISSACKKHDAVYKGFIWTFNKI